MAGTAAQFAEVGRWIDHLRGEIGVVATVVRDLTQIVARHNDEIAEQRRQLEEYRQHIRQVFSRMEQHDARMDEQATRIEEMTRDIRRILDTMERRRGDGGRREA
jgi:methyl-accepting chemotaxis protein